MSGQVVQITINVTDANAAEAVQQVVTQLNALGPAGLRAGAEAGAGLDQVSEHSLSSRENLNLVREDLGLEIPRAMRGVIAESQILGSVLGAVGSAFIAIGAAEILVNMGKSVYELYEKWFDVDAVTSEYLKKLDEAAQKQFLDPGNAQAAVQNLQQINDQIDALNAKKAQSAATWGGMIGAGERYTPGDEKKRVDMLAQQAQLAENANKYQNQALELGISEQQKFVQTAEKGYQQIKDLKDIADQQSTQQFREGKFGEGPGAREALLGQYQEHEIEATAKIVAMHRQETDQIIAMQNEAVNAGLQGNALRAAQEQEEIAAITRRFKDGEIEKQTAASETSSVQQKFAAQALRAQQQLEQQARDMADEAAQAGLKGQLLIQAQLATQLRHVDEAEKAAVGSGGTETPEQTAIFKGERASKQKFAGQKSAEEQQQFNDKIRELTQSADGYQSQGYSRIEAETQRHLAALGRDYEEEYGKDESKWVGYQAAKTDIMNAADREMGQMHARTMKEITKEEQEAARLGLPDWLQAEQAIIDAYKERVSQIDQAEQQELANFKGTRGQMQMIDQEFNAARVAARKMADAQMQRSEEETRDRMAQGLQSLFRNPAQFFEQRAMDTAFQLMANEMLSTFKSNTPAGGLMQLMLGMGPEMNTSTNPLDAFKSAIGMGGHGTQSATGPSMVQFQQGSTTLLTGSQALMTAATALQTAAGSLAAGGGMSGLGGVGGGGGGFSIPGLGGGEDAGVDLSSYGGGSSQASAMMMPGLSTSPGMTGSLGNTFDNSMMLPGLDGIQMDSALGSSTSAGTSAGSKGLGKAAGVASGGLTAGMSIYNAYQNSDPLGGMIGGAMGGMEIGMALGGPMGAAIGAIAGGVGGLLAGIFGDKGKGQARDLDEGTIQPALAKDLQDYEAGRSGYNSLAGELHSLEISAQNQTQQMGSGARNYFYDTIRPEIHAVLSTLQKQERGGRSAITLSAAQYHSGGWTGDFGDMATSDTEGFVHAMANEFIVKPTAAAAHAPILQAMNSGTNFAYSHNVQPRMPAGAAGGSPVHVHIQTMDAKSFAQWAAGGGGLMLMSALNQANRQYGGVGRG